MYSNCLIEALKAKVKDPKNVKIHMIPSKVNNCGGLPHFWWAVGDTAYDFKRVEGKCGIWFNGKLRSCEKAIYEEFLFEDYRKVIAKKFARKGLNDPFYNLIWHEGRPSKIEANNYYINIREGGVAKVRLVNKKDLDKYKNIDSWRIAEDDAVVNLLLNVENNEDGYEF